MIPINSITRLLFSIAVAFIITTGFNYEATAAPKKQAVTVQDAAKTNGSNAAACLANCRASRRAAGIAANFGGFCLKQCGIRDPNR